MRTIEFTSDYANRKKGDKASFDGMLTNHMVNVAKVAKYVDEGSNVKAKEPTGKEKQKATPKKEAKAKTTKKQA